MIKKILLFLGTIMKYYLVIQLKEECDLVNLHWITISVQFFYYLLVGQYFLLRKCVA